MGQLQKKREKETKNKDQYKDLKKSFESIRDIKIKKTRIIKLIYVTNCGCGLDGVIEVISSYLIREPSGSGSRGPSASSSARANSTFLPPTRDAGTSSA